MKSSTMNSSPVKAVAASILLLAAATATAAQLTVTITGITEPKGQVVLALFDSEDAFDNGGAAVRGLKIDVTGDTLVANLDNLPAGQYGIKLYHDANGNGELDRNLMGIPSEGYGFSGNKGSFGPPPFADAAFVVDDGSVNTTTIKVR